MAKAARSANKDSQVRVEQHLHLANSRRRALRPRSVGRMDSRHQLPEFTDAGARIFYAGNVLGGDGFHVPELGWTEVNHRA